MAVTAPGTEGSADAVFSIVVPVHNEAASIAETASALLDGLPAGAEVIFICNGCTDASLAILERVAGGRARLLDVPVASKSLAIREAERWTTAFPRFYIDSDVLISGRAVAKMARRLLAREADLVSPRIAMQLDGASLTARLAQHFAMKLPHQAGDAFHSALGVSRALRERWGDFPEVMSDDTFIEAHVDPGRKAIVQEALLTSTPPQTFGSYVRVRARWERGLWQLQAMGVPIQRSPNQKRALVRMLFNPRHTLPGLVYFAAKLLGLALAAKAAWAQDGWYTDTTSRSDGGNKA